MSNIKPDSSWFILELKENAKTEYPWIVQKSIQKFLRVSANVVVPYVVTDVEGDTLVQSPFDGYAFVEDTEGIRKRLSSLFETTYVSHVLTTVGRNYALIKGSVISDLLEQVHDKAYKELYAGDRVRILSGPYKNLNGFVVSVAEDRDDVHVYLQLRSKEALVHLPRSVLEPLSSGHRSGWLDQIQRLRNWAHAVKEPYPDDFRMLKAYTYYNNIKGLVSIVEKKESLEKALSFSSNSLFPVLVAHATYDAYIAIQNRLEHLRRAVSLSDPLAPCSCFQAMKESSLAKLRSFALREKSLSKEIGQLEFALVHLEDTIVDNVLIDGFNLVFRMSYAPNMKNLCAADGRPTGIIFGFLRSLNSLHKRFPKAHFHVCWDGSSQRRKKMNAEYKGQRESSRHDPLFDQVAFLKDLLKDIGVAQHWNPDEEADDVIATLVQGPLKEQRNVIVSMDNDLLQLVTDTTVVLTPAVGGRREVLFDRDAVQEKYGVPPKNLVSYRAFAGDSSDNLPGVSRVPKKVIAALVRSFDDVSSVYASGLVGLTKKQYERMQEAKERVTLNESIMKLVPTIQITTTDPNPDKKRALEKLSSVAIQASTVDSFFQESSGFVKE